MQKQTHIPRCGILSFFKHVWPCAFWKSMNSSMLSTFFTYMRFAIRCCKLRTKTSKLCAKKRIPSVCHQAAKRNRSCHMALWSFLYSCSWSLCWIVRPGPRQTTTEWPCSLSLGPIRPVFFCKMFMNMFSLCLPKLTFKMNQQMPKNEARNFTQNPHIPRHDINSNSNKMWLKPLPY